MKKTSIRNAPLQIPKEDFKKAGHQLVDALADFYDSLGEGAVTTGETPSEILAILGDGPLPENGRPASELLEQATELLTKHSLFNGHPKFFGYITASPAPIGALADLLAAAINPNVGANILSPMATAIEKQTIRWLAEFIGVSTSYGGILVSGGNMANLTAFLAARNAKAPKCFKEDGLFHSQGEMVFYCSNATHTWIDKAAVLFGHGKKAIRWVAVDQDNRMDTAALSQQITRDLQEEKKPFLVIANGGDVSTGAVDDLVEVAAICRQHQLWFHVDGAYGIPAAAVPDYQSLFKGLGEADSIALDPHKWLYAPLEAGCTLVKDPQHLRATFSSNPVYYNFDGGGDEPSLNFYEYGLQNSRGFRALKVWMALQQVGKKGYIEMIGEDIELGKLLFREADKHPELEAVSQSLSIATFRYKPKDSTGSEDADYLNSLNATLLNNLQKVGKLFLSNAVIAGNYCLRACIVNFRTSPQHIHQVIEEVVAEGRKVWETR